ncbi:MAG: HPP family protein [Desulfocapsaceae bacterium]|jgi:CBS-domain-containing membrane protein|nr:HPP family protein [Desulfocapsaceae bacterium]
MNPDKQKSESYFGKMKGITQSPPAVSVSEIWWSWIGAFLGISALSYIHFNICLTSTDIEMLVGSFGASAVLIYGAIKSPLAQPRNLIGGHIISAIIGVACYKLLGTGITTSTFVDPNTFIGDTCSILLGTPHMWLASSLAVATAIAAMHATKTLHPPGGATALIAVMGSDRIHNLGFLYPLIPVGAGALIMLIVALLVNNIPKSRRYPEFWF